MRVPINRLKRRPRAHLPETEVRSLRIGIDGRYIQDHFPGVGRYSYNLAEALARVAPETSFTLYYDPLAANSRFDLQAPKRENLTLNPVRIPVFSRANQWRWRRILARDRIDLFHSPYYLIPPLLSCPSVVTFHDLIAKIFPEHLPSLRERALFSITCHLATRTANSIITVSQASKADLVRYLHLKPEHISVVYEAAAPNFEPIPGEKARADLQSFALPEHFALYVGINKPHKNIVTLVRAWSSLARQPESSWVDGPPALVIAGHYDKRYQQARDEAERLGLGKLIVFLEDVPENLLPSLYNAADIFVFPSLYEGFGLPVLEAMACGLPVLCSDTSSLPEIAGLAAILLPPEDEKAWTDAIRVVMLDEQLRAGLRAKSLARAGEFSWDNTAQATLKVYRTVLASRGKR
ncbi:MAG: glycosyltransferase family 4 protein [Chloroflexi bacterium]|nr:glycosyltransferase family 4 protein [Chloroflexota bacterium]